MTAAATAGYPFSCLTAACPDPLVPHRGFQCPLAVRAVKEGGLRLGRMHSNPLNV